MNISHNQEELGKEKLLSCPLYVPKFYLNAEYGPSSQKRKLIDWHKNTWPNCKVANKVSR